MRNTVIWSFLSLVALASGGLITGCDSDDAIAKSAAGESCDKTSDCSDGLKCLQGTCYQQSSSGGSANEGGDGSGGTVVGPVPPVLGGEGETCTKRADCEDGLSCISSRCTADGGGEGGSGSGPRLGAPGETCVTSSDCTKGLACIPGGYPFEGVSTGIGFVGICTVPTTLTPTGKTCGAECREAKDCCELPQQLHVAYSVLATYGTGAQSCSELRSLLAKANCKTATGATAAQCAALATYCECEADTWSCDAGRCSYQTGCTEGELPDTQAGCPTYTRSGSTLYNTCNSEGACAPEPVDVDVCKRNADCLDMPVTNDPAGTLGDLCTKDECVCHTDSGQCYRKCDSDLDCDAGYNCDTDTSLCTQAPACTTNEECVRSQGSPNAACDDGTCKIRCNSNIECSSNVTVLAVDNIWICGADNFCAPLGCASDAECAQTGTGASRIRMFCTETPEVEGTAIQSAITD